MSFVEVLPQVKAVKDLTVIEDRHDMNAFGSLLSTAAVTHPLIQLYA